jgi:acetyltransferase
MADYPAHLVRERRLADGRTVVIRPIRADDEAGERAFFGALSDEARRLRFQKFVRTLSDRMIHYFTHIDYEKHMAFVCETVADDRPALVGEARYAANPDGRSCEFGIVIADAWHKSGIGGLLMDALIAAARDRGYETMEGLLLRQNPEVRRFAKALGFEESPSVDDPTTVRAVKRL